MITLVLAEDHAVVRQGLKALLNAEPDFRILGETGDGLEAVKLAGTLKPTVLIADLMMPGLNGLEVIRRVSREVPETGILVLSMHADESYVLEALRNGALAYLLKTSSTQELTHAVREVAAGRRYLGPPLTERAIQAYILSAQEPAPSTDPYDLLTTREREVLHLTAEGLTSKEIGERLHISPRTAEKHRSNLMEKLNLNNKAALIQFAMSRGLTQGPPHR